MKRMSPSWNGIVGALVALAGVVPPMLRAQNDVEAATVFLKDGRAFSGRVSAVESDRVLWKLPSLPQPQAFPYDQVDYVEFPTSPEWREAMSFFENGDFEKAAAAFTKISQDLTKATFFPAPGNFASLAKRRLLDCYRQLRRPAEISNLSKTIDWNRLPASERDVTSIVDCWAAVGREQWDVAKAALEKAGPEIGDIDPASAELAYLHGLILTGTGENEEAMIEFGRVYAPDAAANESMAADSMRRTILLMQADPERMPELRALLRLYALLHGNGKLWEDASKPLQKMLAEENASAATPTKPEK
ncbi:MAG: hypothetical protein KDN19_07075 [Verrucomicrobiae bacterium]|nr:hypothetical protein [Verrucomicrobiae bacterium]